MQTVDEQLDEMIQIGRSQGHLTFSQVNNYLPDEAVSPEKLDDLLMYIDELGIEIVASEEDEQRYESKRRQAKFKPIAGVDFEMNEGSARKIEDPIRMYLTQMGEIPLLTREEEISLAKKIEVTRKRFRRELLECEYAMKSTLDVLTQVYRTDLPFDRTIKVSVTEGLEKTQILARMPHNLRTIEHMRRKYLEDAEALILDSSLPIEEKREREEGLNRRRRKIVLLVEELSIRTQRLQPVMKRMHQIADRMRRGLILNADDLRQGCGRRRAAGC